MIMIAISEKRPVSLAFLRRQIRSAFPLALATPMLISCSFCRASTLVSGNVSGTWTSAESPYIFTDKCTVPAGSNLIIKPGTSILMSSGLGLTVNGGIIATGTPSNRITFASPNTNVVWESITVNYGGKYCLFRNCDFSNGKVLVNFVANGQTAHNDTFEPVMIGCHLSEGQEAAISASSISYYAIHQFSGEFWSPTVSPQVHGCVISNVPIGVRLAASSRRYSPGPGGGRDVTANARLTVRNCVFSAITNAAVSTSQSGPNGVSQVSVHNTAFRDCGTGVIVVTAFDGTVMNNVFRNCAVGVTASSANSFVAKNNIFSGCSLAAYRSGTAPIIWTHNCFNENKSSFQGFPPAYGTEVLNNVNQTPCDVGFNIFTDPLFENSNDFRLATNSPCVDAGCPDWEFADTCFPPSSGTVLTDIGVSGGPGACNWLEEIPILPVRLEMSKSGNLVQLKWSSIPRSTYRLWSFTNQLVSLPSTNNWQESREGRFKATKELTSFPVSDGTGVTQEVFKVESLGRLPSD